jgi:hypothetical protein
MGAPLPYGIPPEAPDQPRLHPNYDLDIVIKLLKEIQNFTRDYMENHLPYRILCIT